jgi:hypothetical protein
MRSQIYAAYVAGLCPLQVLMKYGPDSNRERVPAQTWDEASTDHPRIPLRRKRALLLILTLGFAIGAWQLLSRTDERRAAEVSAQESATQNSVAYA